MCLRQVCQRKKQVSFVELKPPNLQRDKGHVAGKKEKKKPKLLLACTSCCCLLPAASPLLCPVLAYMIYLHRSEGESCVAGLLCLGEHCLFLGTWGDSGQEQALLLTWGMWTSETVFIPDVSWAEGGFAWVRCQRERWWSHRQGSASFDRSLWRLLVLCCCRPLRGTGKCLSMYMRKQLVSWGGQVFCRWATTGKYWNKEFRLPQEVAQAPSLENFKIKLWDAYSDLIADSAWPCSCIADPRPVVPSTLNCPVILLWTNWLLCSKNHC